MLTLIWSEALAARHLQLLFPVQFLSTKVESNIRGIAGKMERAQQTGITGDHLRQMMNKQRQNLMERLQLSRGLDGY